MLRQVGANSSRSSSPPKKAKIDPEPAWQEFLEALAAKNIELSDLDYNLQKGLQTSEQARADFLAINLTTPDTLHFDPEQGKHQKIDLTKNSREPNQRGHDAVPSKHLHAQPQLLLGSMQAVLHFTLRPTCNITTPTSNWTPSTLGSKLWRPNLATQPFSSQHYQHLALPKTTSTGTSSFL